jgi:hypothetical protein
MLGSSLVDVKPLRVQHMTTCTLYMYSTYNLIDSTLKLNKDHCG